MDQEVSEKQLRLLLGEGLGLDVSDPNLFGTPGRIVRMWSDLFRNVGKEFPIEKATTFPNEKDYDQLIIKSGIEISSMCSHHFMPFWGVAHFGYLPDKTLVGLSKMTRILRHYCLRPQIQESLTHEVINRFEEIVKPVWCMLVIKCTHACSSCRGAEAKGAEMITSAIGGIDRGNKDLKAEFLQLVKM